MKKKIIGLAAAVILLGISLSPMLSLRAAVLFRSPVSAFTSEIRELHYSDETSNRHIYALSNPPVERVTNGKLSTWAVVSMGPFHYAYYYGEG